MNQNTINPDTICQQAIQAKLNVYQAKEHFESVLKMYNDQVDNLINLVSLMKNRILELEQGKKEVEESIVSQ
jgi:phage shock protein A